MEVHHHPNIEKKNFKEYLLEGLMIFLAVTMGFFAESLRENITGKEKESEYISSLMRDLEKDKVQLKVIMDDNNHKIKGLDSLITLASKDMGDVQNRKLLYQYSSHVSWFSIFLSNDATMSQLKNSGLQFIRHENIADNIGQYDQKIRGLRPAEELYTRYTNAATDALSELLVFTWGDEIISKDYSLVTKDGQKIQVFFNKVKLERGWTYNYIQNLQERVIYNAKLIDLLKKEYHLE